MQSQIWSSTIPLYITHPSSPTPYIIQIPRVSYLPLLLPRLTTFYGPCSSFEYEGILLKNLPVGLLCDLYQPELPWQLVLGGGPLFDIHDTFINSVKEADFVRYGTAKGIMSMSKENSTTLWNSVQDNDYTTFHKISSILLNPSIPLKHIPLRIYIPSTASPPLTPPALSSTSPLGEFKIVQTLLPPRTQWREIQTLGSALHGILPALFPSKRDPILAEPILHGAPVPFRAPLEEVMRECAYADGWLHLCVVMVDA
ncbi:autophagy protein Apg5-domain-containing protein [Amylocarpus encephaloides]|uniref:Autophagy protein 5 n=1 Tax=Amylocarpus encephaloides TaxID=45428 RepID=A0A9P8C3W1_9HELO|nr:autophagy protein Apg5-domain-containing protein [Amylocarpus encephaloides]